MTDGKTSGAQPAVKKKSFNLVRFLKEVKAEMKKVSWLTKRELLGNTVVVAIAVVIVCVLIWICDTGFSKLFRLILK